MIYLLSPAKSLDYDTPSATQRHTQPRYMACASELISVLRGYSPQALSGLMDLSDKLAALNAARYEQWSPPFTLGTAKQAVFAFDGDVYDGLVAKEMDEAALDYAQRHVRILSGLYGVLRPLDLIQPYRLEMGTKLANDRGRDLYAYWGDRLAESIHDELMQVDAEPVVVNLASEEYFKAVGRKRVRVRLVQPVFEDFSGGCYKVVSFYAKRARGAMVRYAVDHRLRHADALKEFDRDGYRFVAEVSDAERWVFRRRLEA